MFINNRYFVWWHVPDVVVIERKHRDHGHDDIVCSSLGGFVDSIPNSHEPFPTFMIIRVTMLGSYERVHFDQSHIQVVHWDHFVFLDVLIR
jgi:hypothetical protein